MPPRVIMLVIHSQPPELLLSSKMKFSRNTVAAIAACSTLASAAPVGQSQNDQSLSKVAPETSEVMILLGELNQIHQKRSLVSGDELVEINKRADNVLSQLLIALNNSGVIGDVWNTITTDAALRSLLGSIIASSIQTMIVQGPALIKAIWDSGLLSKLFTTFLNDGELRMAFLNAARALFSTALDLLTGSVSSPPPTSSGGAAAAPVSAAPVEPTGTAPPKNDKACKREDSVFSKRESQEVAQFVVDRVKETGLIHDMIHKALADPHQSVALLASCLKNGVLLLEEVYHFAKECGLLDSVLRHLSDHGEAFAVPLADFMKALIMSGLVTSHEIQSALATSMAQLAPTGTVIAMTGPNIGKPHPITDTTIAAAAATVTSPAAMSSMMAADVSHSAAPSVSIKAHSSDLMATKAFFEQAAATESIITKQAAATESVITKLAALSEFQRALNLAMSSGVVVPNMEPSMSVSRHADVTSTFHMAAISSVVTGAASSNTAAGIIAQLQAQYSSAAMGRAI